MLYDDVDPILPSYKPHVTPLQNKLPQKVWGATGFLMEILKIVIIWMLSSSVYSPHESGIWVLLTHRWYPSMSQRPGSLLLAWLDEPDSLQWTVPQLQHLESKTSLCEHVPYVSLGTQLCSGCLNLFCPIHLKMFLMAACSTLAREEITVLLFSSKLQSWQRVSDCFKYAPVSGVSSMLIPAA